MYLSAQKLFSPRIFPLILLILVCYGNAWTQEIKLQVDGNFPEQLNREIDFDFGNGFSEPESDFAEGFAVAETLEHSADSEDNSAFASSDDLRFTAVNELQAEVAYNYFVNAKAVTKLRHTEEFINSSVEFPTKYKVSQESFGGEKFHWKPALIESLYFVSIQHGFRTIQKKTRREFDGKFFNDWGKSVKNLGGWRDGDSFRTNYLAHPLQGSVTGRIFINNSDRSKNLDFGGSKKYWESRFKAMAWSAVWSLQFELGPLSEASIGNVGLYDDVGPNRMGWVDIVVTPTAGTGALIGEDMIDKFILKKWLEKGNNRTRIKLFRTFLTPVQSFTNVLGGKVPWHRDNR